MPYSVAVLYVDYPDGIEEAPEESYNTAVFDTMREVEAYRKAVSRPGLASFDVDEVA
jgi:hypothetical protein